MIIKTTIFFVTLIILIILFIIIRRNHHKTTIEIVVARYNEDLSWTLDEPFNRFTYIVYNKGVNEDFEKSRVSKIISLKNIGRNDHSYLYHIVHNYDSLSDIIVFFTGSVNIERKRPRAIKILEYIEKNKNAVIISDENFTNGPISQKLYGFELDSWCASDTQNSIAEGKDCNTQKSSFRPLGKWFSHYFHHTLTPQCVTYSGILSINKKDVLKHNKEWYTHLLHELEAGPNPEAGHYIERSWCSIFNISTTNIIL